MVVGVAIHASACNRFVANNWILFIRKFDVLPLHRPMALFTLDRLVFVFESEFALRVVIKLRLLPRFLAVAFRAVVAQLTRMVVRMTSQTSLGLKFGEHELMLHATDLGLRLHLEFGAHFQFELVTRGNMTLVAVYLRVSIAQFKASEIVIEGQQLVKTLS